MTNYSRLLQEQKIKKEKFSKTQIQKRIDIAFRDLETAQFIINEDKDWAYSIAYNSMLQIGRAYMMSKGIRPTSGEGGHKVVFEYLKFILPKKYFFTLNWLDKIRQKRNRVVYDTPDIISQTEVNDIVDLAKDFVPKIFKIIKSSFS